MKKEIKSILDQTVASCKNRKELMNILVAHNTFHEQLGQLGCRESLNDLPLEKLYSFYSSVRYDIVVVEASEASVKVMGEKVLNQFKDSWVLFAGDTDNHDLGALLKSVGFTRFIRPERIASVVASRRNPFPGEDNSLSVMLFDDDPHHQNMLDQIVSDYNHTLTVTESFSVFYSAMSSVYDFIFVNLNMKECEIPVFVKKMFGITNFKKAAVIPFYEFDHCMISDLYSGLNKISRVILTLDELFHFLVQYLYKRELELQTALFSEGADLLLGEKISYTDNPEVSFATHGCEFMTAKPEIDSEGLINIERRINSIKKINCLMAPYLWMVNDEDPLTCGPGA